MNPEEVKEETKEEVKEPVEEPVEEEYKLADEELNKACLDYSKLEEVKDREFEMQATFIDAATLLIDMYNNKEWKAKSDKKGLKV